MEGKGEGMPRLAMKGGRREERVNKRNILSIDFYWVKLSTYNTPLGNKSQKNGIHKIFALRPPINQGLY
jgi:hypothetical protein